MKVILKHTSTETGHRMLTLLSHTLVDLEGMANDLEREFGKDVLNRKIGELAEGSECRYSLRDRFGSILDGLLLASLDIAGNVGIDDRQFREAIDQVIGDSRIFDGEYDQYSVAGPLGPLPPPDEHTWWDNAPVVKPPPPEQWTLEKGQKRWWRPRPR